MLGILLRRVSFHFALQSKDLEPGKEMSAATYSLGLTWLTLALKQSEDDASFAALAFGERNHSISSI